MGSLLTLGGIIGIGAATGSWVSGLIFDLSGNYHLAFVFSIVSYLGGCVTFWRLRRAAQDL